MNRAFGKGSGSVGMTTCRGSQDRRKKALGYFSSFRKNEQRYFHAPTVGIESGRPQAHLLCFGHSVFNIGATAMPKAAFAMNRPRFGITGCPINDRGFTRLGAREMHSGCRDKIVVKTLHDETGPLQAG